MYNANSRCVSTLGQRRLFVVLANSTDSEALLHHIPFPSGKSNFFSGLMICSTFVIDFSYPGSIWTVFEVASNTVLIATLTHNPAEEEHA